MKKLTGILPGLLVAIAVICPTAQAAGLPLVMGATVNYTHATLTITGQNFGSNPVVTLDNVNFTTQSASSSQIIANFPSALPPSSFAPGTYSLTVQYKNQLPSLFTVDIGANGPQGPQGVAGVVGPRGLQGIQGLPGPAGVTGAPGPMGLPGPIGPAGVAGAVGPAGPIGPPGATGARGAQGLQGATGATGPAGPGATSVSCANGNTIPTAAGGHYIDCGDGTLIDSSTGLMWEKKVNCGSPDAVNYANPHCDLNGYSADGILYSDFLGRLNQNISLDGMTPCFANHCDWRVPKITELQSILLAPYRCSTNPCIDPAFGPTMPDMYWSSTSLALPTTTFNPISGWTVDFLSGIVTLQGNNFIFYARAVRGGQ